MKKDNPLTVPYSVQKETVFFIALNYQKTKVTKEIQAVSYDSKIWGGYQQAKAYKNFLKVLCER